MQRMHRTVIEAWIHREAPFEQIVSAAGSVRRSNINPLFQIMVVMQNLRTFSPAFGDLQVEAQPVDTHIAEFDMLIEMFERPDGLTLRFSFNANLYLASEIEAFARRFESVLWAVVEDPAVSLSAIDLMGPAAQAQS